MYRRASSLARNTFLWHIVSLNGEVLMEHHRVCEKARLALVLIEPTD
jgi:hypothetical protein